MCLGDSMNIMTKEKPYNTLNAFYREQFGQKVFKISLDGGFTCPNKDGSKGLGGCIYCTPSGSGDFAGNKVDPLHIQFQTIKQKMHKKWDEGKYIAYFQANTNTYASVERLQLLYLEALSLDPNIVGLNIATRCDALSPEIYDLLESIQEKTMLTVELGLQSIHEESALWMNRGHDLDCFVTAVAELRKRHINVVVHVINGLPNETKEMMVQTTNFLNHLDIQGIKIHMLHIMKNTVLGHQFIKNPFPLLSLEEYADVVCDQITHLHPDIIIHRLTGDAPKDMLIEPVWSLKKFVVMNEIDKILRNNKWYQGCSSPYHNHIKSPYNQTD